MSSISINIVLLKYTLLMHLALVMLKLTSYLSVRPGISLWYLDNGLIICGWSMIKVGLIHFSSINSPTSLSRSLAVVLGAGHSTYNFLLIKYNNINFIVHQEKVS